MMQLWLSLLLLICTVAGVIYYALAYSKETITPSQQETNRNLYQNALLELQGQYNASVLGQKQFEQDKIALQKNFANTVVAEKPLHFQKHALLAVIIIVIMAVTSVLLYKKLGASEQLNQLYAQQTLSQKVALEAKQLGSADKVIEALQQHLVAHPDQAQGWYLLGRLYFTQNQFDKAANAFERAAKLAPQRADIAIQLAEVSYLATNKSTQKLTAVRLQQALRLSPDDPAALNLKALMAYHAGHYQEALSIWQGLMLEAPADSSSAAALQAAISKVEAKLNQQGIDASVSIPVTVTISPKIASHIGSNDMLLVYAKAEHGPPMPVAIKKLAIPSFPYQITLSDQDSMLPNLKLSSVGKVVLYARISKSGQALPQSGDLEGHSVVVAIDHPGKTSIVIRNIVP